MKNQEIELLKRGIQILDKYAPAEQVDADVNQDSIKRIKKELLLRFDLSASTTVEIGTQTFDKDTALKSLEAVKEQQELVQLLQTNVHFKNFALHGDRKLFKNINQLIYDEENILEDSRVYPFFAADCQLQLKHLDFAEPKSIKHLDHLLGEIDRLPKAIKSIYENHIFDAINLQINALDRVVNSNQCIVSSGKWYDFFRNLQLNPALRAVLNKDFLSFIYQLPTLFDGLKYELQLVLEELIFKCADKDPRMLRFQNKSIEHLIEACDYLLAYTKENGWLEYKDTLGDKILPWPQSFNPFHLVKVAIDMISLILGIIFITGIVLAVLMVIIQFLGSLIGNIF